MDVVGAIAVLLSAIGTGALTAWLLLGVGSLVARIRRVYRPKWQSALQTFFERDEPDEEQTNPAGTWLNLLPILPALGGLILGVTVRDALLSPYLVFVGLGLTWFWRVRKTRKAQAAITAQVKALVVLFRSRFAVGESPFAVLAEIEGDLPPGVVGTAVRRAVNIYGSSGRVDKALTPLRDMNNPYLARLILVLETGGSSGAAAIAGEVKRIENDLKERDRLGGQARASLALLKGTTRFLQAANLAVIAISVALPLWRDFFTSTLQRRGTFLAATLFVLLASFYFDQESGMQEEKAL
ncbi:MAG: hypothetical protein JW934_21190 [Anaerolineae bacterium]|nr:hypothetical protein [Anaerolineae bacterium]